MKKRENTNTKNWKKYNFIPFYILSVLSLLFLIYLIIDIKNNIFIQNIDLELNNVFSNIQSQFIINISTFITNLFEPLTFIILSLIIILYLFYKKRNKEAFLFLATTSLAFIIGNILKIIIARPRPYNILINESTFSFPSTHALMAVIFFGMLMYLSELHIKSYFKKTLFTVIGTFSILVMGLTRIILSAHYFSDVLAGFSLGVFLFCVYIILINKEHILK